MGHYMIAHARRAHCIIKLMQCSEYTESERLFLLELFLTKKLNSSFINFLKHITIIIATLYYYNYSNYVFNPLTIMCVLTLML